MTADRIERSITIAAAPQRVWEALTEPEHVATWFGTGVPQELDLRPGGEMVLDHGPYGRFRTVFVDVEPPRRLSYRWASGFPDAVATSENATLVEFTIEDLHDGTTRLTVVESGFATLTIPEERVAQAGYESHSAGWSGVIEKVAAYVEGRDRAPLVPAA